MISNNITIAPSVHQGIAQTSSPTATIQSAIAGIANAREVSPMVLTQTGNLLMNGDIQHADANFALADSASHSETESVSRRSGAHAATCKAIAENFRN